MTGRFHAVVYWIMLISLMIHSTDVNPLVDSIDWLSGCVQLQLRTAVGRGGSVATGCLSGISSTARVADRVGQLPLS
ncbi:hypothetical protein BO94DRAFT_534053 [Aspergillus sclerotioniger CBS 115572]|uniref:Uncharacterized protein n=1 Tax=Aspergillus sclerotioniger CBS 115572 TaxID=1450535 RepID=A0A317WYZ3_9EURO|nr:hypothetical protein BO94DRAFT_534053 [Aspergillus sclerotioniger CBS 115572]PWY90552.1 hypothetical protein BO94DRAFT_534053 [Aspergillus sclerotioniger CBS 115572]